MRHRHLPMPPFLLAVVVVSACQDVDVALVEGLVIANVYPAGNESCAAVDTPILVTFSQSMNVDTVSRETVRLQVGTRLVGTEYVYDVDSLTLDVIPSENLQFGRLHSLALSRQLKTAENEQLAADIVHRFRTVPQGGCSGSLECFVDDDCTDQVCSVTSACVDACVVDEDCPGETTCSNDACL